MLSFTCFQKYVWSKHKIRLTNTGFVWPSISWKLYIKTSPEKQNFKLNNVKKKKKRKVKTINSSTLRICTVIIIQYGSLVTKDL